ncbi:DEAD/DEAH box helicase family protein [Actinomyces trachealis]|uniref:DEAD/DEAH box helicase family protein n=1 Tax=Actinomyces trachealis TaxID=2763540 RepID=UPI001892B3C1|nr:DEAD/DEAH box helicase family protein [Actinomyces trachealis]
MTSTATRPLASWRQRAPFRDYQTEILRSARPGDGATVHVVAPPGAGKTVIGLGLAVRNGRRALVLAPTTVIRAQWARQAADFFTAADGAGLSLADEAPTDGRAPADLTVLTYQSLSVVDADGPWEDAARQRWATDLMRDGRTRDSATDWLDALVRDNPAAYKRGISSRAATIRSRVNELDDDAIAALLGAGARQRLDAIVAAGIATIIVDECHHLRAHWALVVHYLQRRLRAAGARPTLIGLTATEPSREDPAWDRYHALLGDVTASVPIPAVVRAGHLAPYRPLAWFTLPTTEEVSFLSTAGAELSYRIGQYLLAPDGIDYLLGILAPGLSPDALAPGRAPGGGEPDDSTLQPLAAADPRLLAALAAGFDADPTAAVTAAALLARTDRYAPTPLSTLVAPLLPSPASLDTENELSLLARYALDRLLPDPARRADWDDVREGLRGFGISLTDSGIRAGRSPLDVMTAASRAKDTATIDILRHELDALGSRLRAVVVTDAAERSAPHRALDVLIGADRPGAAGGATRCFSTILADADLRALHPVLLTASRLAVGSGDGVILDALRERTGLELTAVDDGWTLSVTGGGARSAEVVLAISELVAAGQIRIIVGTRGLLGEGWDCPAVNTLVDLTTVTTSTTVQQLRGRTIRIDPGWEEKVSHNWSVVCLLPGEDGLRARADLERFERRHARLWAVPRSALAPEGASGDGPGEGAGSALLTTGAPAVLEEEQMSLLGLGASASPSTVDAALVARLNAITLSTLGDRADEREAWHIDSTGSTSMVGQTGVGSARHAHWMARPAVRISSLDGVIIGQPPAFWRGVAGCVLASLRATGRVGEDLSTECLEAWCDASGNVLVSCAPPQDGASPVWIAQAEIAMGAVADLLAPTGRRPRFVLVGTAIALMTAAIRTHSPRWRLARIAYRRMLRARSSLGRRVASAALEHLIRPLHAGELALPLPTALGRSREGAEALAAEWRATVGPCRLHLVQDVEGLGALAAARGRDGTAGRVRATRLWIWD